MLETVVSSPSGKLCRICPGQGTIIIGERINPTGKPRLLASLIQGDLSLVREEALRQIAVGADILDVNVGGSEVEEEKIIAEAVRMLSAELDVPLCLDSSKPEALQAALEAYTGKALVNSVTGEDRSLDRVLPLVKHHGAAVVGLCLDKDGIPPTPEGRLRIAAKILNRAKAEGIPSSDVLIDCLATTIAAEHEAALTTLQTIKLVGSELGCNTVLGASNISYGLPDRQSVNTAFFVLAVNAGLTAAIVDPSVPGIRRLLKASDLLLGHDVRAQRYIKDFRSYG